jgi:formamidopyrimidine-DNA glycosylase
MGSGAAYPEPVPELPDIVVYIEALQRRVEGQVLETLRVASPALLRTFDPPYQAVEGQTVLGFRRIGKRIVLVLSDELFLVIHLMVAGRLRWKAPKSPIPKKVGMAALDFPNGTLLLTEQGTKKRSGIWVIRGEHRLAEEDRGGAEPLQVTRDEFAAILTRENRTLKRALTDPRLFSGIGNAYSDEILWEAELSPATLTRKLDDTQVDRLFTAVRTSLERWTETIRLEVGEGWPEKVTAFRADMAVHGRYGLPCPRCGQPVQRIVHADNESNYCVCQTHGKLLADRSLSRLLGKDWPKTLEELEELKVR